MSTRPDLDARFMTTVLRGAISLPTRAYFRVTPDEWRLEGPLTPIGAEEMRRCVRMFVKYGVDSLIPSPKRTIYHGREPRTTRPISEARQGDYYRRALAMAY